jgi:hypothetical protein
VPGRPQLRIEKSKMSLPRVLAALARPARLPTVWSNCLAGWWLGGGERLSSLPVLFSSVTMLYLGGAFLNDVFDAEHDRLHRAARPIPASGIPEQVVWRWGVTLLAAGALILLWCGTLPALLGLGLVFMIVLGNAAHRRFNLGPVIDGLCRFLVYLVAGSAAARGINGWLIWCGLAICLYRAGVGFLWTLEEAPRPALYWPVLLLMIPVGLALVMDAGVYRETGLLLSAVLVFWILKCLRQTFWAPQPNVRGTVFGLMSGIVFVDWLTTCPARFAGHIGTVGRELSFAFLALFVLTLLLQRLAPEQ